MLHSAWVTLIKDVNTEVAWNNLEGGYCVKWKQVCPLPMNLHNTKQWEELLTESMNDLTRINTLVDKFNLIVPVYGQQKTHYQFQKIIVQLQDNPMVFSNHRDNQPAMGNGNHWIVDLRPSKLFKFIMSILTQKGN